MFRINVELYPGVVERATTAWARRCWRPATAKAAVAMYEKSLELNPESPNGKEMLERIRSEATVN